MTTKENYVHQVFHQELMKYPTCCINGMPMPTHEDFDLEYVPPQYDPLKVQDDMPQFYRSIHSKIIDFVLKKLGARYKKRIENRLFDVFSQLDRDKLKIIIDKYLDICGKIYLEHEWDFAQSKQYKRILRNRIPIMIEDLSIAIKKCLNDLAYKDKDVPHDVNIFMRMMLG